MCIQRLHESHITQGLFSSSMGKYSSEHRLQIFSSMLSVSLLNVRQVLLTFLRFLPLLLSHEEVFFAPFVFLVFCFCSFILSLSCLFFSFLTFSSSTFFRFSSFLCCASVSLFCLSANCRAFFNFSSRRICLDAGPLIKFGMVLSHSLSLAGPLVQYLDM